MHHLKRSPNPGKVIGLHENFFFAANLSEIKHAEEAWGFSLPSQLITFYYELGWGQLQTGENGCVSDFNCIASPEELISIAKRDSDWLMPYSQLEPDTLPFFQVGVDLFLCLRPKSDTPNAVYWMWGGEMPNNGKICDSLIDFFRRLVVDPKWFNPPKP